MYKTCTIPYSASNDYNITRDQDGLVVVETNNEFAACNCAYLFDVTVTKPYKTV